MRSKECVFCSSIKNQDEDSIVFRDNLFIALLDHRPLFLGHTLLIPQMHIATQKKGDGLRGFFWPRTTYPDAETLLKVRKKNQSALKLLHISFWKRYFKGKKQ